MDQYDSGLHTQNQGNNEDRKKKSAVISPINVGSPIPVCFQLNRVGNGNGDISSEEHF
jgi:hypothetical protein